MDVHVPAALVGGLAGFFVGGFWYSKKVFGTAWGKAIGCFDEAGNLKPEFAAMPKKHAKAAFLLSIPCSMVSALLLSYWLGPAPELSYAITRCALAGAGLVGASFAINHAFSPDRSLVSWAIDAGYHTVQFAVIGLVLGLWH
jgi:hypothetical protein